MDVSEVVKAQIEAIDATLRMEQELHREIARLQEALAEAEGKLRGSRGRHGLGHRRRGLESVQKALADGADGIMVLANGYVPPGGTPTQIPGALLRRTKSRVTVLTEHGEMVFNLSPRSTYRSAGHAHGEAARGWRIEVE